MALPAPGEGATAHSHHPLHHGVVLGVIVPGWCFPDPGLPAGIGSSRGYFPASSFLLLKLMTVITSRRGSRKLGRA